ncbi:MAG: hypothetical protein HQK89_11455 [Nitrospirae bacterium]|nr:hypothetical protein [Nitrospirota bacterium]
MRSLLMLICLMFCMTTAPAAADSSFTQADRDRMIRLEEGLKATNQRIDATNQRIDDLRADINRRFEQVDKRFEQVDKRFEQMQTFMLWGFGILFTLFFSGMGYLIGFVLWDRRTALAPAVRKTKELDEQAELLKKALREAAAKNHDIKEALKHVGLL